MVGVAVQPKERRTVAAWKKEEEECKKAEHKEAIHIAWEQAKEKRTAKKQQRSSRSVKSNSSRWGSRGCNNKHQEEGVCAPG